MNTSPETKNLSAALVEFHKEIGKVSKDASNPFFKSKYATLSNILETIKTPLNNHGLTFVQFPEGENGLTTRLMHSSGEWMEATYSMKPAKEDPQGLGSAITYQRRYSLSAVLGLDIDEDDDGNAASAPARPATTAAPAPKKPLDLVTPKTKLRAAKTLEDLQKVWAGLSPAQKDALKDDKEEMKALLNAGS